MTLTVLTWGSLNQGEEDVLWAQGICMDDYDYIVIAPLDQFVDGSRESDCQGRENALSPIGDQWNLLERILTGACSNCWQRATFRGEVVAVGVAYHA